MLMTDSRVPCVTVSSNGSEYLSRFAFHADAFYWVKRDSYLPMGSQGLKAVTKAKLGYDPLELDPEDMTPFAVNRPQVRELYGRCRCVHNSFVSSLLS